MVNPLLYLLIKIYKLSLGTKLLFAILYITCSTGFSQSIFKPGYIINNDNDTIHGLLDFRSYKVQAVICTFKENQKASIQKFTPDQIKAYRFIDGKYFVSEKVVSEGIEKSLFLEYIVDGVADLYYFKDRAGAHFLIQKEDGKIYSLTKEKKVIKDKYGDSYVQTSHQYIGILKSIFNDAMEIHREIENADLNHKALTKVVKDYHEYICNDGECIIYEEKLPPVKFFLLPYFGVNLSNVVFLDQHPYRNFTFTQIPQPTIGISFNTIFPRLNERFSIEADLNVGKAEFYSFNRHPRNVYEEVNEILFSTLHFGTFGLLKYNYPTGRFRPNISAGAGAYHLFQNNFIRRYERVYSSTVYSYEVPEFFPLAPTLISWAIRTGFTYKINKKYDASLQLRYDHSIRALTTTNADDRSWNFFINKGVVLGISF